ncbi:MAG: hypothetical protein ACO3HN_09115 [Opitutales bacterium]
MCSVELKKPMHPMAVMASLLGVTLLSCALLYFGVPGTAFHGMKSGVFFPMQVEFDDARFMDHLIKCDSKEVTAEVRKALVKVQPDYPVAKASVFLTNYPSGYKFHVIYATYYGQHFSFGGEKWFRRGAQVGEPTIDAEIKAKDDAFEKAIRDAIEAYFKSKGAHG